MSYPAPSAFLQRLLLFPLYYHILFMRLTCFFTFLHCRNPQVIRRNVPVLNLSQIDAGESTTADLLYQAFSDLLFSLYVVEHIAVFIWVA